MKPVRIAAVGAGLLALVSLAGVLQPSSAKSAADEAAVGGITVTGTGTATVTPDGATMSFGTVSQARTAAAALAANSQVVARVIDALRGVGIAKKDLQTSEVSLSPRTNGNGDEVTGYTATNTVTANVRELGSLGRAIDVAVAAGGNQIYGPGFLASDQDAAYRRALQVAVADARVKAQTIAGASGVSLGRVATIIESGASSMPPTAAAARDAAATPIEPGTETVEASVSVTFAVG
ncbi:MAG TPA: SIMPL domain-containing protein [Gaiellaceae bacterium]